MKKSKPKVVYDPSPDRKAAKVKPKETRKFIVHDREYWLSKDQLVKELGIEPADVEKVWQATTEKPKEKKVKREAKGTTTAATPEPLKSKPSDEQLLAAVKEGMNTSTALRDHFKTNRSFVRKAMKRLQAEKKVTIEIKKNKQQVYRLA